MVFRVVSGKVTHIKLIEINTLRGSLMSEWE